MLLLGKHVILNYLLLKLKDSPDSFIPPPSAPSFFETGSPYVLTWNLLCNPRCPITFGNLPASVSVCTGIVGTPPHLSPHCHRLTFEKKLGPQHFLSRKYLLLFYCSTCMAVTPICLSARHTVRVYRGQRAYSIFWNWWYKQLLSTGWVLRINPWTSGRTLNCWATSFGLIILADALWRRFLVRTLAYLCLSVYIHQTISNHTPPLHFLLLGTLALLCKPHLHHSDFHLLCLSVDHY